MEKVWQLSPKITQKQIKQFPEVNPVILQLLINRELDSQDKIDEFFHSDYSQDIHDPFLFLEMQKAIDRIYQAVKKQEKTVIYGDYDVDGVTSTAILYQTFKKIGLKNLKTYIPDREEEGYSLNPSAIEGFKKQKIQLIITCDCGITNSKEVKLAKKYKIETIITDHHPWVGKLPPAFAVINPQTPREKKYPFGPLAGVGVAFKLIQALLKDDRCKIENKEAFEKWLLDMVALGTIADCMPLLGENRTLVKYGLIVLNKTANLGIRALLSKTRLELGSINSENASFQISPRLNAAGRVHHANDALDLLLAKNSIQAAKLAENLNVLNLKRQKAVEAILKEIQPELKKQIEDKKNRIIILRGENWPIGILGLVAGNLTEKYNRPTILLSIKEQQAFGRARSTKYFNLSEVLDKLKTYFSHYGGHARAAGCTLKNNKDFEKFAKKLRQLAEKETKSKDLSPILLIEASFKSLDEVNWDFYDSLEQFEPFGQDNFKPKFLVKNVNLDKIRIVGKKNQHAQLTVAGRKMIFFNSNHHLDNIKENDKIDVIFQLGVNQWNSQRQLEIKIVDFKKTKAKTK